MITVYKYELPANYNTYIDVPKGGEVLHLDVQNNTPFLWILIDTEAPTEQRRFRVYGTGHEIPTGEKDNLKFTGTFFINSSRLEFHVFEVML